MAFLRLEKVNFMYPGANEPAVLDVSFSVERGAFCVLCGATGSGKSTLLRLLKREIAPLGESTGEIFLDGQSLSALSARDAAGRIGYVMQRPEQQIVTDKVWHELAFGLENLGLTQQTIARRVAEMAAYFGMESWFDRPVSQLSGGQKQLLNLAAVMVMQPDILILDEPTAQLDPIAASEFIATIHKINREMGLTVLMIEHRLEEVIPLCDQLLILDQGKLIAQGAPGAAIEKIRAYPAILSAMPAAARLYHALQETGECPLNVRKGRELIACYGNRIQALPAENLEISGETVLEMKDIYFRYEKNTPDVLDGLSFSLRAGEICCIMGGNGSGKSTMMTIAAGLQKPHHGKISIFGKKMKDYSPQALYRHCLTLLPQDVQTVFLRNTVREELQDAQAEVDQLPFDLAPLMDRHPYDLSGGEQQLVALAKVLSTKPRLLLMDEPTKGLDAASKEKLADIFRELKKQGMSLLIVTHDVEFAALCADQCALFFRGNIISQGTPRAFFGENQFYTTAVSCMTRGYYQQAVTVDDVVQLCTLNGRRNDAE